MIRTFSDGSVLKEYSARALCHVEIWNGNRLQDENHIARISNSLDSIRNLDKQLYTVVLITVDGQERTFVIDGQHRLTIMKRYFQALDVEDFQVLVVEVRCSDESEIIQRFKLLNQTKAIHWKEDPVMIANMFVDLLCREFNKNLKKPLIKPGKTNKPYLSSDRLREALIQRSVVNWRMTPQEFALRCREINDQKIEDMDDTTTTKKRAIELNFALGIMDDFAWFS